MIPLIKLTDDDLREMAWRRRAPVAATRWPRSRLIQYLEFNGSRRKRMKRNLGIREYVYRLLERVIGHTDDGMPIGLGYKKIMLAARRKFADSAVDERHIRWYANKYRADGGIIPVHRERSKWT